MPRPAAVIIAFHKPGIAMARRQIASLVAQQDVALSVTAVFDGAETANDPELRAMTAAAGFLPVVNDRALGVRGAFARGLSAALETAESGAVFAYADQDDHWHPGKLARSIARLDATDAALVHCDARVLADDGSLIAASLHRYESRRNSNSLAGTLILNAVTGMTAVFTAEAARRALRLMERYGGTMLHDHLTAIAAASTGALAFLDEPLVDYMQHGANQLGAKVHRSMFRRRGIGTTHLAAYRGTSAAMFEDRRSVAKLLQEDGLLPPHLAAMFGCGAFGRLHTLAACLSVWSGFVAAGDFRRAMLTLRMCDARFHPFTVEQK